MLNALLERSFADVGRYEKIKKIPKNQKKKSPLITLVVPVTSQTKAEWGGGCRRVAGEALMLPQPANLRLSQ